jgi:hypothetical protein
MANTRRGRRQVAISQERQADFASLDPNQLLCAKQHEAFMLD